MAITCATAISIPSVQKSGATAVATGILFGTVGVLVKHLGC